MPDRIIRDELVKSDPWLGLRRNTHRLAFIVCLLEADDRANLEAGENQLWRLWRDPLGLTDRQAIAEILLALTDADMLRLYDHMGKRYAHIPKFRQRLRYVNGKHPRPPENIEDKEISQLLIKSQAKDGLKSDSSQTTVGPQSAEVKRSEVKRSEVKRSEVKNYKPMSAPVAPPGVGQQTWSDWVNFKGRKLTAVAYRNQVAFLAKQQDPNACIEQSLRNGWAGLFSTDDHHGRQQTKRSASTEAIENGIEAVEILRRARNVER